MTEIKELVEKLRALEAKATPQPWHVMAEGFSKHPSPPTVYHAGDELNYVAKCADTWTIERTRNQENAELIAATRNALPQLLAAIELLSSQVEELKAGWQPIETAPRDGTSVLLAVEWKPKDVVGEAYWDVDMEEWWWMNTSPSDSTGEFVLPDYILGWRPLPAPPARSALSLGST